MRFFIFEHFFKQPRMTLPSNCCHNVAMQLVAMDVNVVMYISEITTCLLSLLFTLTNMEKKMPMIVCQTMCKQCHLYSFKQDEYCNECSKNKYQCSRCQGSMQVADGVQCECVWKLCKICDGTRIMGSRGCLCRAIGCSKCHGTGGMSHFFDNGELCSCLNVIKSPCNICNGTTRIHYGRIQCPCARAKCQTCKGTGWTGDGLFGLKSCLCRLVGCEKCKGSGMVNNGIFGFDTCSCVTTASPIVKKQQPSTNIVSSCNVSMNMVRDLSDDVKIPHDTFPFIRTNRSVEMDRQSKTEMVWQDLNFERVMIDDRYSMFCKLAPLYSDSAADDHCVLNTHTKWDLKSKLVSYNVVKDLKCPFITCTNNKIRAGYYGEGHVSVQGKKPYTTHRQLFEEVYDLVVNADYHMVNVVCAKLYIGMYHTSRSSMSDDYLRSPMAYVGYIINPLGARNGKSVNVVDDIQDYYLQTFDLLNRIRYDTSNVVDYMIVVDLQL